MKKIERCWCLQNGMNVWRMINIENCVGLHPQGESSNWLAAKEIGKSTVNRGLLP